MEQTPCWVQVRWPLLFSSLEGKYLDALVFVSPDQLALLPDLMIASQVDFTGKRAAAWR